MTYKQVLNGLMQSAVAEPNIKFSGCKDIYELNSLPNLEYSVFYITPNTFTSTSDAVAYDLNLYYIDRWDETANNQIDIQSFGITVLTNIINRFVDNYDVFVGDTFVFTPFYQRFKDMTAGVFVRVTFTVNNEIGCEEI